MVRNVWRGLAVGAVIGDAIGLSMDLGSRLGKHAALAGTAAREALLREHGPEIASAVTSAAARGAGKIKEADLPGKISVLAERARNSDTAHTRQPLPELQPNRRRECNLTKGAVINPGRRSVTGPKSQRRARESTRRPLAHIGMSATTTITAKITAAMSTSVQTCLADARRRREVTALRGSDTSSRSATRSRCPATDPVTESTLLRGCARRRAVTMVALLLGRCWSANVTPFRGRESDPPVSLQYPPVTT